MYTYLIQVIYRIYTNSRTRMKEINACSERYMTPMPLIKMA